MLLEATPTSWIGLMGTSYVSFRPGCRHVRQMVRVSDIYYNPRGRQENGCGQAKDHHKVRVQKVLSGRQARGEGRQYGQAGGF